MLGRSEHEIIENFFSVATNAAHFVILWLDQKNASQYNYMAFISSLFMSASSICSTLLFPWFQFLRSNYTSPRFIDVDKSFGLYHHANHYCLPSDGSKQLRDNKAACRFFRRPDAFVSDIACNNQEGIGRAFPRSRNSP
jgi:hypothetical protein